MANPVLHGAIFSFIESQELDILYRFTYVDNGRVKVKLRFGEIMC